jgi:hypothetical protein
MKRLIAIALTISLPISSFADCTKPVTSLEEGAKAPCTGYLFTPEKELEVRLMKKESELLKAETENLNLMIDKYKKKEVEYTKVIDLQIDKTELWKTKAEDITMKYVAVEENRTKRDFGFILMGIGLTVLSGWAIGQAAGR